MSMSYTFPPEKKKLQKCLKIPRSFMIFDDVFVFFLEKKLGHFSGPFGLRHLFPPKNKKHPER